MIIHKTTDNIAFTSGSITRDRKSVFLDISKFVIILLVFNHFNKMTTSGEKKTQVTCKSSV